MEQCIHSYNNIRFFFRKSISLAEFLTLAEFITFAVVLAISLTQPEFVALAVRFAIGGNTYLWFNIQLLREQNILE